MAVLLMAWLDQVFGIRLLEGPRSEGSTIGFLVYVVLHLICFVVMLQAIGSLVTTLISSVIGVKTRS